jgi:uncharacterized membrane protein (UPF0136 family)
VNRLDPRTVRAAMWGALLIWIGAMMIVDEHAGVASIGAGVILLVAVFFRRAMGRRAGFVLTLMGTLLLALGIWDLNGDRRGIPLIAVALISIGTLVVLRTISAKRWLDRQVRSLERPPRDPFA